MEDPDTWRWIWLVAAVALGVGEITTTGLFLLPFALGALVAAVLAFIGVGIGAQAVVFALVSVVVFAALRPVAHRLNARVDDHGIGAKRLRGAAAVVLADIPAEDVGMIRIGGEQWRAESVDGRAIAAGSQVVVHDVRGTRAVVAPLAPGQVPNPPPEP